MKSADDENKDTEKKEHTKKVIDKEAALKALAELKGCCKKSNITLDEIRTMRLQERYGPIVENKKVSKELIQTKKNEEIIRNYKSFVKDNEKLQKLMVRLEEVSGSYASFVLAALQYAERNTENTDKLHEFLDKNPTASTSDILYYVSVQPDFYDDSNIQVAYSDIFPDDIDEDKLSRPWRLFDVIYDWDARIRGIIIEKKSDNMFRVLWTNGVIGEVEQESENIYLVKSTNTECNNITYDKILLLDQLKIRLENIKDSYFDFVDAIIHYAKRKQEHLDLLNKFLDEHPETSTSDVVYFVSIQPDFFEDSVPHKNGFIRKTENADEKEAAEILAEIDKLSPKDLEIVKSETITITKKRKVVKWTHWDDSRYPEVEWTGNWDDMRVYELAIIEAIREHGYRMKGESHQRHPYGVPVFDDGTRYEVSFRHWGELMAAALGIEGEHAYVTWAFCVPPNEKEVFPDPKDWE